MRTPRGAFRLRTIIGAAFMLVLSACGTTTPQIAGKAPQNIIDKPELRKPQPSVSTDRPNLFPEPSEKRETNAAPGMLSTDQLKAKAAGTYFNELDDLNTSTWRVGNIPFLRISLDKQYDTDGYLDQLEATNATASLNNASTDFKLPATVNAATSIKLMVAKPLAQTSSTFSMVLKRADTGVTVGTQTVTLSSTNQIGSYSEVSIHQVQNLNFSTSGLAANQAMQLWLTDLASGAKFFVGGIRITNGATITAIDDIDFTKKNTSGQLVWRTNNLTEIKKLFTPRGETTAVALHQLKPYLAAGGYVIQRLKGIAAGQTVTFNGTFAMPTTTTDQTISAYLQDATTFAQIPNSGQSITVSSVAKRTSFSVTKPASVTGDVELVLGGIPFGQVLYAGNFKEPTTPPPAAGTGLTAEYFDNIDFTGSSVKTVDGTVNFNWGSGAPLVGLQPTTYSVRWTGQIQAPTTEEYTFYVTSSDGARLMVNGVAVASNWTDHATTTNSGKIKLVAAQNVDFRLEYYRNATNPSAIKLEWQSASRVRAVVPSSALFSSGSEAQKSWDIVKVLPNVSALNLSPLLDTAITYKHGTNTFFWATEGNQSANILTVINNGKVIYGRRSVYVNTSMTVTNLLNGKTADFGNVAQYFDADTSNDQAQKDLFVSKDSGLNRYSRLSTTSSRIGTKSVISDLCPLCLALRAKYLLSTAALAAETWKTLLYYNAAVAACLNISVPIAAKPACFKAAFAGIPVAIALDVANAGLNPASAYQSLIDRSNDAANDENALINCLVTEKCDAKISDPTPNPLELDGTSGTGVVTSSFSLRNLGGVSLSYGTASSDSWLTVTSNAAAGLEQNEVKSVGITARCPVGGITAPFLIANITITATSSFDLTYSETKLETVKLKCLRTVPTLVGPTPEPLRMKTPLGQTATGTFNFKNDGIGTLNMSVQVFAGQLYSLSIAPGVTAPLTISSDVCKRGTSGAGHRPEYIDILANAPGYSNPVRKTISVACTGLVSIDNPLISSYLVSTTGVTFSSTPTGYLHYYRGVGTTYWLPGNRFGKSGDVLRYTFDCSEPSGPSPDFTAIRVRLQNCALTALRQDFAASLPLVQAMVNDPVERELRLGWAGYLVNLRVLDAGSSGGISIIGDHIIQ